MYWLLKFSHIIRANEGHVFKSGKQEKAIVLKSKLGPVGWREKWGGEKPFFYRETLFLPFGFLLEELIKSTLWLFSFFAEREDVFLIKGRSKHPFLRWNWIIVVIKNDIYPFNLFEARSQNGLFLHAFSILLQTWLGIATREKWWIFTSKFLLFLHITRLSH